MPLELQLGRPEMHSPAEIVQTCAGLPGRDCECLWIASMAGLKGSSGRDPVDLRGGSLGDHIPGGAEEWAKGSEIPLWAEQELRGPMGRGLACSASYSFSVLWHGDAFHELGAQSADVSVLSGALPQPSVSPASQQSPWIMELT
jgi:hypothetical protein